MKTIGWAINAVLGSFSLGLLIGWVLSGVIIPIVFTIRIIDRILGA